MKKLLFTTTTALVFGTASFAQDFYIGAAYGVTQISAHQFVGPSLTGNEASLLAGIRFDIGTNVFAGLEAETGKLSTSFGSYPDKVTRGRALLGYSVNKFDLFVAAGISSVSGSDRNGSGLTMGIGGNYHINDKLSVRLEIVQDSLDVRRFGRDYDWDAQELRVGVLFKF